MKTYDHRPNPILAVRTTALFLLVLTAAPLVLTAAGPALAQDSEGDGRFRMPALEPTVPKPPSIEPGEPATPDEDTPEGRARALIAAGRFDEALPELEAAAKAKPDEPTLRRNLGVCLFRVGRNAEAIAQFESVKEAFGKDKIVLYYHSWALLLEGRAKDALPLALAAVEVDASDAVMQNHLAITYNQLGEFAEGGRALSKALALDPGNATLMRNRGRNYFFQGKEREAIATLEEAVGRNATDGNIYLDLFQMLDKAGRWGELPEVEARFDKELFATEPFRNLLVAAYRELGHKEDALRILEMSGATTGGTSGKQGGIGVILLFVAGIVVIGAAIAIRIMRR